VLKIPTNSSCVISGAIGIFTKVFRVLAHGQKKDARSFHIVRSALVLWSILGSSSSIYSLLELVGAYYGFASIR